MKIKKNNMSIKTVSRKYKMCLSGLLEKEQEERQESKTKLGVSYDGIEYRIDYHYNNVDSEPTEGSK